MSALTIAGLSKGFGGSPVLDELDLTVPAGSLLSVIGPSGCGKTTLLRLIAGFLRPDAGSIELDGHPVAGGGRWVPAPKRNIGYVAQEGALFPHLDVAANVGFGLPRPERRARARTRELLSLVELEPGLLDRYPHQLSGGQQQRVALARALARRPSLVLLDEPFAALDARLRLQTGLAVTHALRAAEATAILVTHDQSEALSLTDTVAVMRDGRIVQSGAPAEVYGAPVDLGVARFLGDAIVLPAELSGGMATCALGAVPTEGAAADGPAELLIRPEQLVLGEEGTLARVAAVAFLGHDATVQLRLVETGLGVSAQVLGALLPEVGAEVRVSVRGKVRAYPRAAIASGARGDLTRR